MDYIYVAKIHVKEDGSAATTRWTFDLLLNDEPWLHLRAAFYNDRSAPVRLSGMSLPKPQVAFSAGGESSVAIRVLGYR